MINKYIYKSEEGSTLIVALMILILLSLLGIFAINSSINTEKISASEKLHHETFNIADGGLSASCMLIHDSFYNNGIYNTAITSFNSSLCIYNPVLFSQLLLGFSPTGTNTTTVASVNVIFPLDTYCAANVTISTPPNNTSLIPGTGAEFGSGAEGIGVGAIGGVQKLFSLESIAKFNNGSELSSSQIDGTYREVLTP